MKKNKILTIGLVTTMVFVMAACGKESDIEQKESKSVMEEAAVEETENDISTETSETTVASGIDYSASSTDYGNIVCYSEAQDVGYEVDLTGFQEMEGDYTVNNDISLYYTAGGLAGYLKSGSTIHVEDGDEEWLRFNPNTEGITVPFMLVRVEDLVANTDDDVYIATNKEEENTIDNIGTYEIFDEPFDSNSVVLPENYFDNMRDEDTYRIVLSPTVLYDKDNNQLGVMYEEYKAHVVGKTSGTYVIEIEGNNYYVVGGLFEYASYDPSTEGLYTETEAIEVVKAIMEEKGLTVKDTTEGLEYVGMTSISLKDKYTEEEAKQFVSCLSSYTEISLSNISSDYDYVQFEFYCK